MKNWNILEPKLGAFPPSFHSQEGHSAENMRKFGGLSDFAEELFSWKTTEYRALKIYRSKCNQNNN